MEEHTWLSVWCQYEGGSSEPTGETFKILVETDDFEEARNMIRDNKDLIDDFVEHSIQEEQTVKKRYRLQDVMDEINNLTGVNWAISRNGEVYTLSNGKVIQKSI